LREERNGRIEIRKEWKDLEKKRMEELREEKNGMIEEERKNNDGDRRGVDCRVRTVTLRLGRQDED
jgi:hypothetical protein